MLKYSTATSLAALALLVCFVCQGVAQPSSNNFKPRAHFDPSKQQTQSQVPHSGTQSGHHSLSSPMTYVGYQTPPYSGTSGTNKPSVPKSQVPSDPHLQEPQLPSRPAVTHQWSPSKSQTSLVTKPKPSDPRQQKPLDQKPRYPITSNPLWIKGTKKTSYHEVQPRASPAGQKVPQTTYDPSHGSDHQTGVTKNPNYNTCEVEDTRKVQCGRADISSSECLEIGCCYDGYGCYFGKAVTVQCTKDGYFIVVVSKYSTLPSLDLNSISMLGSGENCVHIDSNSEFAIYYFAVGQCGTIVREEESGVIVYENVLVSYFETQFGKLGGITRDTTYDLLFQCRYMATAVHSLVVELIPGTLPLPVASTGPVRVHMQLANGRCTTKGCNEVDAAYTSFYALHDYPVHKVLREPVYVQVELLERTDPLVVLTLDHCWTTTSPNPHTFPQWDILINGCPNPDDPYTAELVPVSSDVSFPGHYRRFLFYMFAFLDDVSLEPTHQQLYLHCSTSLCLAAPGSYCEPNCFRKLKKREAAAIATEKTVERNVVVSAGPVNISAPSSKKE